MSEDDFQKSNQLFNINTDKELITYINKSSFIDFIEKLSKESQSDSIFYKNYLLLLNLSADCIQIRIRFIYLLNQFSQ